MTSAKKIEANRRNALRSTGPRTAAGKARSRKNALRHGLAAVLKDHTVVPEAVAKLASVIAADSSDPLAEAHGITFAEAEMAVRRARAAQAEVLAELLEAETAQSKPQVLVEFIATAMQTVGRLHRYERRALSRRRRAMRELMGIPTASRAPRSRRGFRRSARPTLLQPAPLPPLPLPPPASAAHASRAARPKRLSCPKRKKIDYADPAVLERVSQLARRNLLDDSWLHLFAAGKIESLARWVRRSGFIVWRLNKALAAQKKSEPDDVPHDTS